MCRRTESKLAKKLKELSTSEAERKKAHDKVLTVEEVEMLFTFCYTACTVYGYIRKLLSDVNITS